MSGLIGNGVTQLKLSVKKDKELEGTGEPVKVRTVLVTIKSSWFSSDKRMVLATINSSWFSSE